MPDFEAAFSALKTAFRGSRNRLAVKTDTATHYALVTKKPSPFPQHKGHPMEFGSVKIGKTYVSFHLMPLYMVAEEFSPELKKRMQGKTCFNFTSAPDATLLGELQSVVDRGLKRWEKQNWI